MTIDTQIFKDLRHTYSAEQILDQFNIHPNGSNKILCIQHHETEPSMAVYENSCYCFGCKQSWDIYALAKALLEKRDRQQHTMSEVMRWFETTKFKEKSNCTYHPTEYLGPVDFSLVEYWHSCLKEEHRQVLHTERKLTDETINTYMLGWRPDWSAFVIPFWRGVPGKSEIDILQFRLSEGKQRYLSLKGHSRGSVMNAHLLTEEQPYLVVLMGSFDALLALQDGLLAVGLNGSFPFKAEEKERVQALFAKQHNIIVVPDNNPSEYKAAYKLTDWIGGQVRYFSADLEHNTDYIDYRRAGFFAYDFKKDILQLNFPDVIIENIIELLSVGDPFNLAWAHARTASRQSSPEQVANAVRQHKPSVYTEQQWWTACKPLLNVATTDDLLAGIQQTSKIVYGLSGGW